MLGKKRPSVETENTKTKREKTATHLKKGKSQSSNLNRAETLTQIHSFIYSFIQNLLTSYHKQDYMLGIMKWFGEG